MKRRNEPLGGGHRGNANKAGMTTKTLIVVRAVALLLLLGGVLPAQQRQDRVAVGEQIRIEAGETVGDVLCVLCSVVVKGVVSGDVVAVVGHLTLDGDVQGDALAITGHTEVRGKVGGDATAIVGDVRLRPGAQVGGDATAVFGRVSGVKQARVGGDVTSIRSVVPIVASGVVVLLIACLLAALFIQPLLALLSAAILGEKRLAVLAETARRRAGMSFVLGLGVVVASFLLSVISFVIPLWIPGLQFPFSAVIFVLAVVGYAGISFWVGHGMASRAGPLVAVLLGAVLITILQPIPIVGWLAGFIFFMMALGVPLLSGFGTSPDWLTARARRTPTVAPSNPPTNPVA